MRYRVEVRYREDTGEIELFQVEVVEGPEGRQPDHDAEHDRVTAEIAGVVQPGAPVQEVPGAAPIPRPLAEPEREAADVARPVEN